MLPAKPPVTTSKFYKMSLSKAWFTRPLCAGSVCTLAINIGIVTIAYNESQLQAYYQGLEDYLLP